MAVHQPQQSTESITIICIKIRIVANGLFVFDPSDKLPLAQSHFHYIPFEIESILSILIYFNVLQKRCSQAVIDFICNLLLLSTIVGLFLYDYQSQSTLFSIHRLAIHFILSFSLFFLVCHVSVLFFFFHITFPDHVYSGTFLPHILTTNQFLKPDQRLAKSNKRPNGAPRPARV